MRHAHNHAILPPALSPNSLLPSPSSSVPPSIAQYPAGLAHDARNMLAAMDIYCELLNGPGVLSPQYRHLVDELRLLRESSSNLMDRLLIQAIRPGPGDQPLSAWTATAVGSGLAEASATLATAASPYIASPYPGEAVHKPVLSVAGELLSSHKMLCALAGPKVHVELTTGESPEGELMIASVDFTRVLINLVRNAAEAMGTGGRILISSSAAPPEPAMGPAVRVSVEDNGPGIPLSLLERIFDLNSAGVSGEQAKPRMSFRPRGLGLRIVRELVEGGGGIIRAARLPERGSRFEIVLPFVTKNGAR